MRYAVAMAGLFLRHSVLRSRSLMALAIVGVNVVLAFIAPAELDNPVDQIEDMINDAVFGFVLPFTALMYGVAIIRDEMEGGTLPYLLLRPIPRRQFYLGRLAAAWGVVTLLSLGCAYFHQMLLGAPLVHAPIAIGLGAAAYVAIFGLLSAIFAKPFVIGLVLTFAELGLSNIPIAGAYASVRANLVNIGGLKEAPDVIEENLAQLVDTTVDVSTSYMIVVGVLVFALTIGVMAFERREFVGGPEVEQ